MAKLFIFKLLILLNLLAFTSCSLFENRRFFSEMEYSDEGIATPGQDFAVIPGDSGQSYRSYGDTLKRTPASAEERSESRLQYSLEEELVRLEAAQPPSYFTHYLKYQDQLPSTSQRIYFLRLSNIRERNAYIEAFGGGLYQNDDYDSPSYRDYGPNRPIASTQANELNLGMSRDDVESLLGTPSSKEVSGSINSGNERWTYNSSNGNSYIYFSNGQVQGWYD